MLNFILPLIILIVILILYIPNVDHFRPCNDCEAPMEREGTPVINPFVYPYSGTSCVPDLYIMNKDSGVDPGFRSGPLTHLSTPDHVELVGY